MGIAKPYRYTISEGDNFVLSDTFQDIILFEFLHSFRPYFEQSRTILPSLSPNFILDPHLEHSLDCKRPHFQSIFVANASSYNAAALLPIVLAPSLFLLRY